MEGEQEGVMDFQELRHWGRNLSHSSALCTCFKTCRKSLAADSSAWRLKTKRKQPGSKQAFRCSNFSVNFLFLSIPKPCKVVPMETFLSDPVFSL